MATHRFAQTNIQLFNQLLSDGYSSPDVGFISNAYELAVRLFSGRYKAAGKTFISHLIGTASILGSLHVPAKLVAAGLLHAAYTLGDFGDGGSGISDAKRDEVTKTVSIEVEDYVARYAALNWNTENIIAVHDDLLKLDAVGREVLLIRLANELEEHLDLAALYCPNVQQRIQYITDCGRLLVAMAERLEFPNLAPDLEAVFKETISGEVPAEIHNRHFRNASFVIPPKSYKERMSVRFSSWLDRVTHALLRML